MVDQLIDNSDKIKYWVKTINPEMSTWQMSIQLWNHLKTYSRVSPSHVIANLSINYINLRFDDSSSMNIFNTILKKILLMRSNQGFFSSSIVKMRQIGDLCLWHLHIYIYTHTRSKAQTLMSASLVWFGRFETHINLKCSIFVRGSTIFVSIEFKPSEEENVFG